jgi:hypothetical protein
MQFICGVCKNGYRRIISADTMPTVQNLDDMTAALPEDSYDWGPESSIDSSEKTARIILATVASTGELRYLVPLFAEQVVRVTFNSSRMWMLTLADVEQWVSAHRLVA